MIQPLRAIHRRVFLGLALALPAVFVAALAARPKYSPPAAVAAPLPSSMLVRKSDALWQKHRIQTRLYALDMDVLQVVLQPNPPLRDPDLLLYWSPADVGDQLPADAQLLGSFAPEQPFILHLGERRSGTLVLYSVAHRSVVDMAAVERVP